MISFARPPQVETVPPTGSWTLLELIGGHRRLEDIVDRFVERVRTDPELSPVLAGIDLASFKRSQVAFFTAALGGAASHARSDSHRTFIDLEGEQFFRIVLLLYDLLISLGLPPRREEQIVLAVIAHALNR